MPANEHVNQSQMPRQTRFQGSTAAINARMQDAEIEVYKDEGEGTWHYGEGWHPEHEIETGAPVPLHPQTGLPIHGDIDVNDLGMRSRWNPSQEAHPDWAKWSGTTPSARSLGEVKQVPLSEVSTIQRTVSAQRINQMMTEPGSGSNPRIPQRMRRDVPVAFESSEGYSLVDGNHRTMTSMLQGRSHQTMRVLTHAHRDAVTAHVAKINNLKASAKHNPHRNPYADYDIASREAGGEERLEEMGYERKPGTFQY